eukprot:391248-Rhodomonas_salina.1
MPRHHLRRHVHRRPVQLPPRPRLPLERGRPKVRELRDHLVRGRAVEEAVAGLYVLVADAVLVEVLEAADDVTREPARRGDVEGPEGEDELRESARVAELHQQLRLVLHLQLVHEAHNVRVFEQVQQAPFCVLAHTPPRCLVLDPLRRAELPCHARLHHHHRPVAPSPQPAPKEPLVLRRAAVSLCSDGVRCACDDILPLCQHDRLQPCPLLFRKVVVVLTRRIRSSSLEL